MTTDMNALLPVSGEEKMQIWIIGSREQVNRRMNEFCVKRVALDRANFTPIIPMPHEAGKYMTILVE